MLEHEGARQRLTKKPRQLGLQAIQIDSRRSATLEVFHLAINTSPVTGIVRVQVDADRHSTSPTRDDGIDITKAGAIPTMILNAQHRHIV